MHDTDSKLPFAMPRGRKHSARFSQAMPIAGLLALFAAGCIMDAHAQKPTAEDMLKSATETANKIREATGSKPTPKAIPAGDPCAILSLADVQKAFPGAKAGERSRRLEEYGITECAWKGPNGNVVLGVQESNSKGTAKEDARGMAQGFTDPLKRESLNNVRFETFNSMGSQAVGFIEQADPNRGILSDGALLAMRNGDQTIWLMSNELPKRDRAAGLKAMDELGKAASKRLRQ